jgi:hypothetical protein
MYTFDEATGDYVDTGDGASPDVVANTGVGSFDNPIELADGSMVYQQADGSYIDETGGLVDQTGQSLGTPSSTEFTPSTGGILGGASNALKSLFLNTDGSYNFGKMAALGAGLASISGLNKANKAPVGFQGVVPNLTAVQQQVPMQADPNRVPGSAGRRYFTDMQYAAPSNVGAAQQNASIQARQLQSQQMATGGLTSMASGKYLRGSTDGMADELPAQIGKDQPAKLSHGEFVIPADVVSHLGNGNSDAGANVLYAMMAKVRKARTGTEKQGKKIKPEKFTPGGGIQAFATGGVPSSGLTGVGTAASSGVAGTESNLSNWAGPTVTNMIGKGTALSETPYQAYTGPLTAGASDLQTQAFGGASSLNVPTEQMGGFTPGTFDTTQANKYMNPYLSSALDPVLAEQRRQAEIDRVNNAGRMTQQGAYGGGRQAIMESEGLRNLANLQSKTTAEGYKTAYDKATDQFNKEQGLGLQAQDLTNKYGLGALEEQSKLGAVERGITSEGIAADKAQFEEERADPFKKIQFQQSLFQGMPVQAQSYTPAQTSTLQDLLSAGSMSTSLYKQLQDLGVIPKDAAAPATTPAAKA